MSTMASGGVAALQPTFMGHVNTTWDSLLLFEGCLNGQLCHVPRRPHDRERSQLIRSGCVFIYEENASGIKRWTDGITWSPSRILGNFLVYRELDRPFPPGEKKRAMKKNNRRQTRPGEPYPRPSGADDQFSPTQAGASADFDASRGPTEIERSLIGSLVDSYGFKQDGLVKKTMSVTVHGVTHHLVSYYTIEDVTQGKFRTPSQTESLSMIRPRQELTTRQSFRVPLEETEEQGESRDGQHQPYGYRGHLVAAPGYPMGNNYYMNNSPYSPTSYHPASSGAAYTVGVPAPGYLGQSAPKPEEYGMYPPTSSSYQRSYDGMTAHTPVSSLPPNMGSLSASIPDRTHSTHSTLYHQGAGMAARPVSNHSPVGLDSRSPQSYRSDFSNGTANLMDSRRPMQPSPSENGDRNGAQVAPSPYTPNGDRQSYYSNGASSSLANGHFSNGGSMQPWTPGTGASM